MFTPIKMQVPSNWNWTEVFGRFTPTGNTYRIDVNNRVSVDPADVGYLIGLGFTVYNPESLGALIQAANMGSGDPSLFVAGDASLKPGANGATGPTGATGATGAVGATGPGLSADTKTATNSATLEWTGLTGRNYLLTFSTLVPVTDGASLLFQLGEGVGPTWLIASYYDLDNGPSTSIDMTGDNPVSNNPSDGGALGSVTITGMDSGKLTTLIGVGGALTVGRAPVGGTYLGDTTAKTAIRLMFNTGNIASGYASLISLGT